jgi:hypothetical protein
VVSVERQRWDTADHRERAREAKQREGITPEVGGLEPHHVALARARYQGQLETHIVIEGAWKGLEDHDIVGSVFRKNHGESLTNKGFFVQPKKEGLVSQGECLT